jgi:hypothetical protein
VTSKKNYEYELPDNSIVPVDVGSWHDEYLLSEIEFERILHGSSKVISWIHNLLYIIVGYLLNISKEITSAFKGDVTLDELTAEISIISLLVLSIIILSLISKYGPSKKQKVIKEIQKYFDDASRIKSVRRR